MITLTFLVLLVCLAWLAKAAWQRARAALRDTGGARSPAAIGNHGAAARSIA